MLTLVDRAIAVQSLGRATFAAILVVASAMLPAVAVAHDSNGPGQLLQWKDPATTNSTGAEAAPVFTGTAARLQVDQRPLWHPYRSRKRSRSLAGTDAGKAATPAARATSIYDDRTLRRGDAVMTSAGLRIFQGSATFPYRPADFATLDAARSVPRSLRKDLALYDHQIPDRLQLADHAPDMVIHLSGLAQR